ncbi:AAA family ATPase [Hansschlegelia zhihuaiae]|uniref:AAA family ATPase n=2 Tax=Hansschlegelia zhihuaiae TaxID=405005 RepID=A0A4V1KJ42_9HYPH|nr:AAA family ATPase [Hansschlegelia zhihuaiae]
MREALTGQILQAGKAGRGKFAEDLQKAVTAARAEQGTRAVQIARPRGDLAELLDVTYPGVGLSDAVLRPDLREGVERIVIEHKRRAELEAYHLKPRRKLLFVGPPGTGKSMTAHGIATELGLPLFTVQLDGVITKYMGASASKLRLIFDSMIGVRGVYFFDEIDAIAASRGAENDIGEARRLLNSFLQLVDRDNSHSIIIAATNHSSLLDRAVFRRFDSAFHYELPTGEEARQVLKNNLLAFEKQKQEIDWDLVDERAQRLSQADLVAAAVGAARKAVLENEGQLTTDELVWALDARSQIHAK